MLSLGDLDGAMSFQWAPSSVVQYRCCPLCAQPTCGVSSFIDCTCCADATGNNNPTNNARTIMLSVLFTGEASLVSSANRAREQGRAPAIVVGKDGPAPASYLPATAEV